MKQGAVSHEGPEQGLLSRNLRPPFPQVEDQPLDVDFRGAYFVAPAAADAESEDVPGFVVSVEEGGQHQPDAAHIDVAEHMAANNLVHRTDIGAGPALDAFQRFAEARVARQFPSAVVQKYDMQVLAGEGPSIRET